MSFASSQKAVVTCTIAVGMVLLSLGIFTTILLTAHGNNIRSIAAPVPDETGECFHPEDLGYGLFYFHCEENIEESGFRHALSAFLARNERTVTVTSIAAHHSTGRVRGYYVAVAPKQSCECPDPD